MRPALRHPLVVLAIACCLQGAAFGQNQPTPKTAHAPAPPAWPEAPLLPPLKDPATIDQIHEYLRLSGDLDSYRSRWIAAVEKNRSIGAPYWPESFWTDLKAEMAKTDLMPMFITMYQHSVSRDLMQQVLDTYHTVGAFLFKFSPAALKLSAAQSAMSDDSNKLTLARSLEVTEKVYTFYKPQIQAARPRYLAEHPGYVGK